MSHEASLFAWNAEIRRSSHKFVLVAMARRAGEEALCWPSVKRLSLDTSLDRKTVLSALSALERDGFISDTGERKGVSGQVKVYRIIGVVHSELKESQKRDSPKNGTVPKFPHKSPVFPTKESQKRDTEYGIENKREYGVINKAKKQDKPLSNLSAFPSELNIRAWHDWLEYKRDEKRFKFKTEKSELTAVNKLIKETGGSHDLQEAWIENSIANGYSGIFGRGSYANGSTVNQQCNDEDDTSWYYND